MVKLQSPSFSFLGCPLWCTSASCSSSTTELLNLTNLMSHDNEKTLGCVRTCRVQITMLEHGSKHPFHSCSHKIHLPDLCAFSTTATGCLQFWSFKPITSQAQIQRGDFVPLASHTDGNGFASCHSSPRRERQSSWHG